MLGLIVLVVVLSIIQVDDVARESLDLVEVNHFFDEQGREVFTQVIFWDWSESDCRYMVRAWRLVKNPNILPVRDWDRGGYRSLWQDGEQLRDIHALSFRETWTQYDPELVEREFLTVIVFVDTDGGRYVLQPTAVFCSFPRIPAGWSK